MLELAIAINPTRSTLTPWIVRLWTNSFCFHTELRFSDGISVTTDPPEGVHYIKRNYDYYHWLVIPLTWIDSHQERKIRDEAHRIVTEHAKYDWLGAIFGKFSYKLQKEDAWFCSELCQHLLEPYTQRLQDEKLWWSPKRLWKAIYRTCNDIKTQQLIEEDKDHVK